jgi:hypothetical protein
MKKEIARNRQKNVCGKAKETQVESKMQNDGASKR